MVFVTFKRVRLRRTTINRKLLETDFKTMTLPFRWQTLDITSETNINNGYTCPAIYSELDSLLLSADS